MLREGTQTASDVGYKVRFGSAVYYYKSFHNERKVKLYGRSVKLSGLRVKLKGGRVKLFISGFCNFNTINSYIHFYN